MHNSTTILLREAQVRLAERREGLLDLLGLSPEQREELEHLTTAHLIALSHIRPTLFDQ